MYWMYSSGTTLYISLGSAGGTLRTGKGSPVDAIFFGMT